MIAVKTPDNVLYCGDAVFGDDTFRKYPNGSITVRLSAFKTNEEIPSVFLLNRIKFYLFYAFKFTSRRNTLIQMTRLFLVILIFLLSTGFSLLKKDAVVKRGNVLYSFEGGKMQCLSEEDEEGHIFILLKSLKENTQIKFINMEISQDKEWVLVGMMRVEEDTNLCAGWTNLQEVKIVIMPKKVKKVTLSGEVVHQGEKITVMSAG
jgi:hypothetical protein